MTTSGRLARASAASSSSFISLVTLITAWRPAAAMSSAHAVGCPGAVEVLVGTSAADLPCRGAVRLTGAERAVGPERQLFTPVETRPA
jgi:hypothetical protein